MQKHLFQRYKNLGDDNSHTCIDILNNMYTIAVLGVHNSGKKTLVKKIEQSYCKSFHINENIIPKFYSIKTQSVLSRQRFLICIYASRKIMEDIYNILSKSNEYVHIVIIGHPNLTDSLNSRCFIYRCKCPSYNDKFKILNTISQNEYNNTIHVEDICNTFYTYHDCLLALEMYNHNNKNVYSYMSSIQNIVENYICNENMTHLQLRTNIYNLTMHLSNVASVIYYAFMLLMEKIPHKHFELSGIASECEYNYKLGNKDPYHYEYMFHRFKNVYMQEKKSN